MANPKVKVDITGDASGVKRAAKDAGEALEKVDKSAEKAEKSTSKLSETLGKNAKDELGKFGELAEKAGIDVEKMGTSGLVAGAAVAGFAAFVADGVAKLSELTAEVRQYQAAGDLSADTASRLNAVFKDFGVAADDGVDAIKTLAEEAGDAPEKFERFGVAVAKTEDGGVDMVKTLGNVADRFKAIKDPTERAALGANLFGDNWLRIAPLLEKGSSGINRLTKEVDENRIANDELIAKQFEMEQATRDLKTSVEDLQIAFAKDLIPEITQTASDLSKLVGLATEAKGAFGGFGGKVLEGLNPLKQLHNAYSILTGDLDAVTGKVETVAPKVKTLGDTAEVASRQVFEQAEATEAATAAAKDAEQALKDQQKATEDLWGAVLTINGTVAAAEEADRKYIESLKVLADESKPAAERIAEVSGAADANAQAQVNQAKKLAEAAGETFNAEQAALVYRDALVKMRDQAADPGLRQSLDDMIGRIDTVARNAGNAAGQADAMAGALDRAASAWAGVKAQASFIGPLQSVGATARAHGGPVSAGRPYLVGEQGPEVMVPGRSGTIIPNGGVGGMTINVYTQVGTSPRDVGRELERMLREYRRAT